MSANVNDPISYNDLQDKPSNRIVKTGSISANATSSGSISEYTVDISELELTDTNYFVFLQVYSNNRSDTGWLYARPAVRIKNKSNFIFSIYADDGIVSGDLRIDYAVIK